MYTGHTSAHHESHDRGRLLEPETDDLSETIQRSREWDEFPRLQGPQEIEPTAGVLLYMRMLGADLEPPDIIGKYDPFGRTGDAPSRPARHA